MTLKDVVYIVVLICMWNGVAHYVNKLEARVAVLETQLQEKK